MVFAVLVGLQQACLVAKTNNKGDSGKMREKPYLHKMKVSKFFFHGGTAYNEVSEAKSESHWESR